MGNSKKLPFSSSSHVSTFPLEIIHSDVWTSPILFVSGCNIMSFLLMISQAIHGFFQFLLNLMFLNASLNSNYLLKIYCQEKSSISNLMEAKSFAAFALKNFSSPMELCIIFHSHTPLNKMGLPNANIDMLLKLV